MVGDVVIVETGDEVPADGQLFESTDLQVDESSLTGEPMTHKAVQADQQATNGEAYLSHLSPTMSNMKERKSSLAKPLNKTIA